MVDLSNKYVATRNYTESEKLLRAAVVQGYSMPKGLKILAENQLFRFITFPLKSVQVVACAKAESTVWYSELFGDEDEELNRILEAALRFCRSHGYSILRVYADEEDDNFEGSVIVKTEEGGKRKIDKKLPKPRKVTLDEIEKKFGGPIEIIS